MSETPQDKGTQAKPGAFESLRPGGSWRTSPVGARGSYGTTHTFTIKKDPNPTKPCSPKPKGMINELKDFLLKTSQLNSD